MARLFAKEGGEAFECSSDRAIERFVTILRDKGQVATIRSPRGRDILAACGQMKSASVHKRARAAAENEVRDESLRSMM